jgi:signal transduction histidine kinase
MAIDASNLVDARTAVTAIEAGSRDALREMRQMLGVLRQGQPNRDEKTSPAPGLRDLTALLERVRSAGIDVASDETPVRAHEVPADVQLAAFRIVQESLTNIISHAPGASARVAIRLDGVQLHIDILDTGADETTTAEPSLGSTPWAGTGLVGMRERAEFLKGNLEAGPRRPGPGWRVSASLPLSQK